MGAFDAARAQRGFTFPLPGDPGGGYVWIMYRLMAATLLVAFLFVSAVPAAIVHRTFTEVAPEAERVVLGLVESVEEFPEGTRIAKIKVLETWRGRDEPRLLVDVTITFACDISKAIPGETALFLLVKPADFDELRLVYVGRGRLPVKEIDGESYVEGVWSLELPEWIGFRDTGVEGSNEKGRLYKLEGIKAYLADR